MFSSIFEWAENLAPLSGQFWLLMFIGAGAYVAKLCHEHENNKHRTPFKPPEEKEQDNATTPRSQQPG